MILEKLEIPGDALRRSGFTAQCVHSFAGSHCTASMMT
jgi:hypothetical protein